MRVIKNYMRTNSTQKRINNTILLCVHKDRNDRLDILTVTTKCIDNSDHRKQVFGAFSTFEFEIKLWQKKLKNSNKLSFISHNDLLNILNF